MKLTELIADAQHTLRDYGDHEVYVIDGHTHYPIKWTMVLPESYGKAPQGYYIRIPSQGAIFGEESHQRSPEEI